MVRFLLYAAPIALALTVYTLVECTRADRYQVRSLSKPAWVVVIILLPFIGAGLWFLLGRPESTKPAPGTPSGAPDDDEQFLRQLETWRKQQQREAELKAREEELKKREDELKNPKDDPNPPNES
ncbi:PLD nuclease N-terminal domain-containing protein [Glutamicibacter endophyticus]|uniref:PLD nuclease N-terminal domain-containing protein n=1 Tax=Glutamicibacter endophyticus TaxID=1522174 RepID=UPI003AEFA268